MLAARSRGKPLHRFADYCNLITTGRKQQVVTNPDQPGLIREYVV